MRIDPKIEEPMREMLGHAVRHELDELAAQLYAKREETVASAIVLCMVACGYVCIDVTGNRWPSDNATYLPCLTVTTSPWKVSVISGVTGVAARKARIMRQPRRSS